MSSCLFQLLEAAWIPWLMGPHNSHLCSLCPTSDPPTSPFQGPLGWLKIGSSSKPLTQTHLQTPFATLVHTVTSRKGRHGRLLALSFSLHRDYPELGCSTRYKNSLPQSHILVWNSFLWDSSFFRAGMWRGLCYNHVLHRSCDRWYPKF